MNAKQRRQDKKRRQWEAAGREAQTRVADAEARREAADREVVERQALIEQLRLERDAARVLTDAALIRHQKIADELAGLQRRHDALLDLLNRAEASAALKAAEHAEVAARLAKVEGEEHDAAKLRRRLRERARELEVERGENQKLRAQLARSRAGFVVSRSALGEPRTTDYCLACGDSPDSGRHTLLVGGCSYKDPRAGDPDIA